MSILQKINGEYKQLAGYDKGRKWRNFLRVLRLGCI